MAPAPGLQVERTALAWQRTGVSASAGSALGLLGAAHNGHLWLVLLVAVLSVAGVGAVVLAGAGAGAGAGARRDGDPDGSPSGAVPSPWGRLLATTGATLLLAVTGCVLAVVALVG